MSPHAFPFRRPASALTTGLISAVLLVPALLAQPVKRGDVALEPCKIEDVAGQARCGTHEVFEDRETARGRKIPLNIVVLPATSGSAAPDPLFALQGGPGQGVTQLADFYARIFGDVRRTRDIVLMDLRGTGKSHPLNCDMYRKEGPIPELMPMAGVRRCAEELGVNADLRLYTTALALADLDDVRAALGYDRINLYGTSYGTRAALEYLRRYPQRVRTMTLKAVVPPSLAMPMYHARDGQRALDMALERCQQDAACRAAFPSTRAELAAVLGKLEREPARATAAGRNGQSPTEVTITRGLFAEALRNLLYSPQSAVQVPQMIHKAASGDLSEVAAAVARTRQGTIEGLSIGMMLSVTCTEDIPFLDLKAIPAAVAGTFLADYRIAQQMQACTVWPRGAVPPDFHEPVRSDVPALLLSGEMDPVTPPAFGEEVKRTLPNAVHVVVPNNGHSMGALGECAGRMAADLIAKGSTEGLDTSCAQTLPAPTPPHR